MRNTLPLIKYGVQYIRTHLKFIWSAPNYFIIQPLGDRLTSYKMAANGEEKAFCVLHFHVSRSVLTVKRELRTRFNPLNAELNPICHLLTLLAGATIVVVSRLRVKDSITALYYSFDYSDAMYIMLDDMYGTMSISTGLYPNLDLWTANKLQLQLQ